MVFAKFMAGSAGRGIRIVAGIALALFGILSVQGTLGLVLGFVGAVVFLAGALNFCLIAPIIGAPFKGQQALNSQ